MATGMNKIYKCKNCGKEIVNSFFGCCDSDCYIGTHNGNSMKSFLQLVNTNNNIITKQSKLKLK